MSGLALRSSEENFSGTDFFFTKDTIWPVLELKFFTSSLLYLRVCRPGHSSFLNWAFHYIVEVRAFFALLLTFKILSNAKYFFGIGLI